MKTAIPLLLPITINGNEDYYTGDYDDKRMICGLFQTGKIENCKLDCRREIQWIDYEKGHETAMHANDIVLAIIDPYFTSIVSVSSKFQFERSENIKWDRVIKYRVIEKANNNGN